VSTQNLRDAGLELGCKEIATQQHLRSSPKVGQASASHYVPDCQAQYESHALRSCVWLPANPLLPNLANLNKQLTAPSAKHHQQQQEAAGK
jgi:hypothetical protein